MNSTLQLVEETDVPDFVVPMEIWADRLITDDDRERLRKTASRLAEAVVEVLHGRLEDQPAVRILAALTGSKPADVATFFRAHADEILEDGCSPKETYEPTTIAVTANHISELLLGLPEHQIAQIGSHIDLNYIDELVSHGKIRLIRYDGSMGSERAPSINIYLLSLEFPEQFVALSIFPREGMERSQVRAFSSIMQNGWHWFQGMNSGSFREIADKTLLLKAEQF